MEDNAALRGALSHALEQRFERVETCAGVEQALAILRSFQPDVVLIDVELSDGSAVDVLRVAAVQSPVPAFVAMSGVAGPEHAFELAQLGVRSYLRKPIHIEQVEVALADALHSRPDVVPHLRAAVGRVPLRELEQLVRETMVSEAMAKTHGSRRGAARLLDVSRQLLQHMLRGSPGKRSD